MNETISYEYESLNLEFSPNGRLSDGDLTVMSEDDAFVATVSILKVPARDKYVSAALELYPDAFDERVLKRALNDLALQVKELQLEAAAKAEEADASQDIEPEALVDEENIYSLIGTPGVLDRYVEAMADVHEVYGDRPHMKVVMLGAISAQLDPPAAGKPVGTNVILIGESGRGKNYIADAVASGLPKSFVYEFESASAKSFYYEADAAPEKFEHTWVYPNEAEAADELVETLRPLLSKGHANHKTVDRDDDNGSRNALRDLVIRGPITATIPTIRNKLDWQLQTRMLVVELEDFDNRVSEHTAKVSDTLLPDYVAQDHANVLSRWHAAFTELTRIRRVVLPGKRKEFRLSANDIPHGARLWRNFLSLMLANAWLEQRNREIRTIADGLDAVVVDAEDYRVAYEVFAEACARSVVNLGDTHRKILNAVYELETADKGGKARGAGFSLRAIAKQAGISPETVRNNRAFLTQSVSLLRDLENGNLSLVKDAEPSWWQTTNLLKGFPRPDEVKVWWEALKPVDTVDTHRSEGEKPIDKPVKVSSEVVDTLPEVSSASDGRPGDNQLLDTTPEVSSRVMDTEKPIDTPNAVEKAGVSSVSSALEGELEKVFEPEGGDLHLDYDFIDSEDE